MSAGGTTVLLLRHGATASNTEGRYMGRSQEPISAEGRYQARLLSRRLEAVGLTAVYCSPLPRTLQTADIVASLQGLEPRPLDALMELGLERWAGMMPAEIAESEPEAWEVWCTDPARLRLDGIEPFAEAADRVGEGLDEIRRRHPGETVAAVTHDGIVRIAVIVALGLPLAVYRSMGVDNASISVLRLRQDRDLLHSLNDTAHLREVPVPGT